MNGVRSSHSPSSSVDLAIYFSVVDANMIMSKAFNTALLFLR